MITGAEMVELGLVNKAVPQEDVLAEAMAIAEHLASNVSPASMATIKHQLNTEPEMPALAAFESSNKIMYESIAGADVAEGITSFLEKRQANFAPLGSGTMMSWMTARDENNPPRETVNE